MDKLEQEIKNRLSSATSLAGVDSEGLWNAISEVPSPNEESKKKRRFGFIWFVGAAVLAGAIFLPLSNLEQVNTAYTPRLEEEMAKSNYASLDNGEGKYTSNANSDEEAVLQHPVNKSNNTPKEENLIETRKNSFDEIQNVKKAPIVPLQELMTDSQAEAPEKVNSIFALDAIDIKVNYTFAESDSKSKESSAFRINDQLEDGELNESITSLNPDLNKDTRVKSVTEKLVLLDSKNEIFPELKVLSKEMNPAKISKAKKLFPFHVYGGIALTNSTFKKSTTGFPDSLNSSLTPRVGYRFGGMVQLKEARNWGLNVGLEYAQLKDRFDKVLRSDTSIYNQNEELVPATNIRTIKHHNNVSVLSVPLELQLWKDTERLRLSIGVGASYSMVLEQSGRLLADQLTVTDYSQDNKRYSNFLSARVSPSVGLKLNEKVMLNALCTFGFQGHGNTSFNGIKSSSVTIMPTVGFSLNY